VDKTFVRVMRRRPYWLWRWRYAICWSRQNSRV